MSKLGALTALVAVAALLSGCGASNDPTVPAGPGGFFRVANVTVDGKSIPCVTWKDGYAGGLSCDWTATR